MYLLTLYLFLYQSYVCISSYAKRALAMSGRVCRFVCPSQSVCHTLVLRSERCPVICPPVKCPPGHLPPVKCAPVICPRSMAP